MSSWVASAAYLLGIGWYIAVCILLGTLIGRWADGATGLEPTFTLIGIFAGLVVAAVGGARMVLRFVRRFATEDSRRD